MTASRLLRPPDRGSRGQGVVVGQVLGTGPIRVHYEDLAEAYPDDPRAISRPARGLVGVIVVRDPVDVQTVRVSDPESDVFEKNPHAIRRPSWRMAWADPVKPKSVRVHHMHAGVRGVRQPVSSECQPRTLDRPVRIVVRGAGARQATYRRSVRI